MVVGRPIHIIAWKELAKCIWKWESCNKAVNLYKKENDPKVKERLLLIIRVREDRQIPFRVVKEMHRSNPWASDWLKRYDKEGIEGLKDRTKSGRPPETIRRDKLPD